MKYVFPKYYEKLEEFNKGIITDFSKVGVKSLGTKNYQLN